MSAVSRLLSVVLVLLAFQGGIVSSAATGLKIKGFEQAMLVASGADISEPATVIPSPSCKHMQTASVELEFDPPAKLRENPRPPVVPVLYSSCPGSIERPPRV